MKIAKRSLAILVITVMFLACTFAFTNKVEASNLLMVRLKIHEEKVGTYYDGYMYNITFEWDSSAQAAQGYCLNVLNSAGQRIILTYVSKTESELNVYGLPEGTYAFLVSAIDANGNILDSHYGAYAYVDYSGEGRGYTLFE